MPKIRHVDEKFVRTLRVNMFGKEQADAIRAADQSAARIAEKLAAFRTEQRVQASAPGGSLPSGGKP